jgi:alkylhydroperoxidase family enzyme
VLAYADAMTISGQDTTDEQFAALREHFSPEEMVELTVHVAFENFRSRFNHAFRIEAQGFCRLPRPAASSP